MAARSPQEPIAIVGMGLRLPGGISTSEEFWDLLVQKKDGKCQVPSNRYNVDGFYGDKEHQQKVSTKFGYFLRDVNLKVFDKSFFAMRHQDAELSDPQLRLLLEVIWECMENSGQTHLHGSNTGVYVGVFGEDWHNMLHKDDKMHYSQRVLSAGDFSLSNSISYQSNLKSPSMTIRTACSSSLTGLHLACQALRTGDCDAALVAGSSLILDPTMTLDMSEQGVLSPSGSCKTINADADGFARGEAINAILIKPLATALREGDPIRAIIRSTAVNSDGKTSHIVSPSTESQETLIRKAYESAGINDFSQTAFVECHGTGTVTGDPLEAAAVGRVFGDHGVYIGSVKPNIGHGEGAAGLNSIIKSILALENKTIPPNINFLKPNPKIPFDKYQLIVPVTPIPWPKGREARISISSFGIGGANAHVVLDSAESFLASPTASQNVLPYGSRSPGRLDGEINHEHYLRLTDVSTDRPGESDLRTSSDMATENVDIQCNGQFTRVLEIRINDIKNYMQAHPGCIRDLAYTLSAHRTFFAYRSFCIVSDEENTDFKFHQSQKAQATRSEGAKIGFVFTGQGAQWVGMGKRLIQTLPAFLNDIQKMDSILQNLKEPPLWTITDLLRDASDDTNTDQPQFSQPLCTAVQLALLNLLVSFGVEPDVVIGHSSGEIAAAYAAGAMTFTESILCAYFRGLISSRIKRQGSMAVVGMKKEALGPFLKPGVNIACENSVQNMTISGDETAVKQILSEIEAEHPDTFVRLLQVNVAYHSHHMTEGGEIYENILSAHISSDTATLKPFYSTILGRKLKSTERLNPKYWQANLESPVLFQNAMQHLLNENPNIRILLEVGPHSALKSPIREIQQAKNSKKSISYIPTLQRGEDSLISILTTLGRLYGYGHKIDFSLINSQSKTLLNVPNYPWDHRTEFWKESRVSQAWRERQYPHHELLGSRCLETSESELTWRNVFHISDVPWLHDHQVEGNAVFPCAGYIAMFGEAIRQTVGSDRYVLRKVLIKSALVLPTGESDLVELMVTMRPTRLTGLTDSSYWYDFAVSSYIKGVWVENCIAQGRVGKEVEIRSKIIDIQPREVSKTRLYDRLQAIGLRYGPRFQGLDNITCHPERQVATARMQNDATKQESTYAIHPATIDFCIQLCIVAGCNGVLRKLESLFLPIEIGHISISPGGPNLQAEATLELLPGKEIGCVRAYNEYNNERVIEIHNGRGVSFDIGNEKKELWHAARIEWRPDISCFGTEGFLRRGVNKRAVFLASEKACILETLQQVENMESLSTVPVGHLTKYASWLQEQKRIILSGNDPLFPEAKDWDLSDKSARDLLYEFLMKDIDASSNLQATQMIDTMRRVTEPEVFHGLITGEESLVDVLNTDNWLHRFYGFLNECIDVEDFMKLCAHSQPRLRVLEIGAGTAATTGAILKSLVNKLGHRIYSQYVFLDISPAFLTLAAEKFKDKEAIEYKILDIEKCPEDQGFELGSFDLIVASNVLHATSSLSNTLRNVRSLLRPGGRLLLHELADPICRRTLGLLFGLVPGWWLGEQDGRVEVPYVSIERWNTELRAAGFSGNDSSILDDDPPYQNNVCIISTALKTAPTPRPVTFLYQSTKHGFAQKLAQTLGNKGVPIRWCSLHDSKTLNADEDIIAAMDLEDPFFQGISENSYEELKATISRLKDGGLLWLTGAAQVGCTRPEYGLVLGFARTIRVELSLDFWTAEFDEFSEFNLPSAASICEKFNSRVPLDRDVDNEYSVRKGVVCIGRYQWLSMEQELEYEAQPNDPKRLEISQIGVVDSLHWVQHRAVAQIQAHEVEVRICYVGLNFKDVMVAMGIVLDYKDNFGCEASGIVTRIGSKVDHVSVGDRVVLFGERTFMTSKIIDAKLVMRISPNLSLPDAASMLAVYMTVIQCLIVLANIEKGQSILIHSATGGVGQAALNISQWVGAEVYATVGSEEKIEYLVQNFGLRRDRIFTSRKPSFHDEIMKATNNRGVDVVLNSLSGDLLHASWECVASYGKMIEIGKRDILEHGSIALDPFGRNRTVRDIFLDLVAKDILKPINPVNIYTADKIPEAIRFMKKGQHIGKIVIEVPDDSSQLPAVAAPYDSKFSSSSTYLMIGGLGGLGKTVTTWMYENGARSFCYLSRSAGDSQKHKAFLNELEAQGCTVTVVSGSVTEMDDIRKAIEASPTPIAGVMQMSVVLRDNAFQQSTHQEWRAVQDPKVKGTWNLHHALSHQNLDFFVLWSSLAGSVGQPGQVSYAAANSFLDSFVQYRHSLGLPCSVIELGGVDGVGVLSNTPERSQHSRSLFLLNEKELIDAVQVSMRHSHPTETQSCSPTESFTFMGQLTVGLCSNRSLASLGDTKFFRKEARTSFYANLSKQGNNSNSTDDDSKMKNFLKKVEEAPEKLNDPALEDEAAWEVGAVLFRFLLLPEEDLDIGLSLESVGVDSLVSIEIRNWWRRTVHQNITALEILNTKTIGGLGKLLVESLRQKYGVKKIEE